MQPKEIIHQLRQLMKKNSLDAWIIPSTDPHQSEYVADYWQARAWVSGFHGSAGTIGVTHTQTGLWTDPRYHLRAESELAGSGIKLFKSGLPGTLSLTDWLRQELPPGSVVGFDGKVMSIAEANALQEALAKKNISLSYQHDLVGEIWQDRPPLPLNPIFIHADTFAGESRKAKLERIRAKMQKMGAQFHLLCALDDLAWTLNIRGSDVDCNPVAIAFAMITLDQAHLFIQPEKVPEDVKKTLEQDGVVFHPYAEIYQFLQSLPGDAILLIDPEKTSVKLRQSIPLQYRVIEGQSLPFGMKAVKNPIELDGIRRMHRRDGAALVRWLYWLDQHVAEGKHTEVSVADKLEEFRSHLDCYQGMSFHTIAGYEANSAIGHYQSNAINAPVLQPRGIFLIDSGAQYLDGTSDITRTISLGQASSQEKQAFTQVLKCHIRLATARFPKGTKGIQLDALAREPLWRQGWNCRHGIGHGVGCFLDVHEGPPRFNETNMTEIEAGMVLSNEPGVYFEGRFGIRIENMLITVPAENTEFGEYLKFETVSLCPIDLDLVEPARLEAEEIAWLNAYHTHVRDTLSPLLNEAEKSWLWRETRGIG